MIETGLSHSHNKNCHQSFEKRFSNISTEPEQRSHLFPIWKIHHLFMAKNIVQVHESKGLKAMRALQWLKNKGCKQGYPQQLSHVKKNQQKVLVAIAAKRNLGKCELDKSSLLKKRKQMANEVSNTV